MPSFSQLSRLAGCVSSGRAVASPLVLPFPSLSHPSSARSCLSRQPHTSHPHRLTFPSFPPPCFPSRSRSLFPFPDDDDGTSSARPPGRPTNPYSFPPLTTPLADPAGAEEEEREASASRSEACLSAREWELERRGLGAKPKGGWCDDEDDDEEEKAMEEREPGGGGAFEEEEERDFWRSAVG